MNAESVGKNKISKREYQALIEDLEDLEVYVRSFSAFLPLAVCYVNPVGYIIDVNQAFNELTGYETSEIIGKSYKELFYNKKEGEKFFRTTLKQGHFRLSKISILNKEGKKFMMVLSGATRLSKKGEVMGCFISFADITELKELQEEMEEKIKKRTEELQKKIKELERLLRLTVGRELKMVVLKEEIKELKKEVEKIKPST